MKKGIGIVKLIAAMMFNEMSKPQPNIAEVNRLGSQKNALIMNYGGPVPGKLPNQRQRRKLARQMNRH